VGDIGVRRIGVVVFIIALAVGFAEPASADELGYVTLVFPTTLGNCPQGGRVVGVRAAVGTTWSTGWGWDSGDDRVYARVRIQWRPQIVVGGAMCSGSARTKWRYYYGPRVVQRIDPVRAGQIFRLGPVGVMQ
jgi:hypothetical protein